MLENDLGCSPPINLYSNSPILNFPDEIILKIFDYLKEDFIAFSQISLVCKKWSKISEDKSLVNPLKCILQGDTFTQGKKKITSGGVFSIDFFYPWVAYSQSNFQREKFFIKGYNIQTAEKKKFKTYPYQNQTIRFVDGVLFSQGYRQNRQPLELKIIDFTEKIPKSKNISIKEKGKPPFARKGSYDNLEYLDGLGSTMLRIALNKQQSHTHYKSLIIDNKLLFGFNFHPNDEAGEKKSLINLYSIETGDLLRSYSTEKQLDFLEADSNFIFCGSYNGNILVINFNDFNLAYSIDREKLGIGSGFLIKDLKVEGERLYFLTVQEGYLQASLMIWDLKKETIWKRIETDLSSKKWHFLSVYGDFVAIGAGNEIRMFNIFFPKAISLKTEETVSSILFRISELIGPYLIVGMKNGQIKGWLTQKKE